MHETIQLTSFHKKLLALCTIAYQIKMSTNDHLSIAVQQ